MNIAAYCRVSTDQTDQLNSLEMQKKFFAEYTEKNGHTLVHLYADEGISGTKIKNRREFLQLMQDAHSGLFEMVVVKDISRFARNTVDFLQSIRALKALGIETTFLTANMTVLGNSEFVLTIFGALAQEESANTSKRIKFGKQLNAQKGRVPNIVYGYDKTAGDYFNMEINQREAAVVRQIFDWYCTEGDGASKIANKLNAQGVCTKRGCKWTQNAVCRILSNPVYTGKIINGKQEVSDFLTGARKTKSAGEWLVAEREDLRIVSPQQFQQAGEIIRSRGKKFGGDRERQSNRHLFSTLIKCGECGYSFRRTVRTYKNTYVRWVCSGHNGRGGDCCPNATTLDEGALVTALDSYFRELLQDKQRVAKTVRQEFLREYRERNTDERYVRQIKKQLDKMAVVRQKYIQLYADDLIARQELDEKLSSIKEEKTRLEQELRLVDSSRGGDRRVDAVIHSFFDDPAGLSVQNLTNTQLKQIIGKIVVDRAGNVDAYLHPLNSAKAADSAPFCNNRT